RPPPSPRFPYTPLFRSFPVTSTLRQFRRYVEWWGNAQFEAGLAERRSSPRPSWETLGVVKAAKSLIAKLERKTPRAQSQPTPATSSSSPAGSARSAPTGGSARAALDEKASKRVGR